jgi:hypothetical protein
LLNIDAVPRAPVKSAWICRTLVDLRLQLRASVASAVRLG